MAMTEHHTAVDSWYLREFNYDLDDLDTLTEVLPRGFWYAVEFTPDGDTLIYLMKNEEGPSYE